MQAHRMVRDIDASKDGKIQYDEFVAVARTQFIHDEEDLIV